MEILDCTLRDGGYYTDWDFNDNLISQYISSVNLLPIDYIEIGYRNRLQNSYLGRFGYSPSSVLLEIRKNCKKKISVMLNEKDVLPENLDFLISPVKEFIDMVRIAVDPKNFDRALVLASELKKYGLEIGFNVMYMSTWHQNKEFLDSIDKVNEVADLICMVDSFGGVTPDEVIDIFNIIKDKVSIKIGFHGHDNLEMGLANSLAAMKVGVDFIDSTVLGMGRGAGNLKTELLLTYLSKRGLQVDFNVLGDLVASIQLLKEQYKWGTNLPYMIAGAYSIPQKDVMGWIANPTYSFNSIVRALDNRRNKIADNAHYPAFKGKASSCLIIGGGKSVKEHGFAIKEFINANPGMAIVFATSRYVHMFRGSRNPKYYCLTGNEAKRLSENIGDLPFEGECVLAPYPRTMGTDVPKIAGNNTTELCKMRFSQDFKDSCTSLALEIALSLNSENVYVIGYDGYRGEVLSEKETTLTNENRTLFRRFKEKTGVEIFTLTPSLYSDLKIKSIYSII